MKITGFITNMCNIHYLSLLGIINRNMQVSNKRNIINFNKFTNNLAPLQVNLTALLFKNQAH